MENVVPESRKGPSGIARVRVLSVVPGWVAVAIGTALVLVVGYLLLWLVTTEEVTVRGVKDVPLTPAEVGELRVVADPAKDVQVSLDGKPVPIKRAKNTFALQPGNLVDGKHELVVNIPRELSWLGSNTTTHQITVDSKPPELKVEDSLRPKKVNAPVTVVGQVRDASRVEVAGKSVKPDRGGAFSVVVQRPNREVEVVATDRAGNSTSKIMTVHVKHPGMRAVHMTGLAWTSSTLREPVLELARQGKIDTVELDIKDESGEVPYNSAVPLAHEVGAVKGYYDARQVIDQLHSMGVRVVGRLVAFKDPVLGAASWHGGHPERVVQTTGGQPWSSGYGDYAFTNFVDPVVRDYNIAIAAEAAKLGFDDILYDYVRRPDGPIEEMRFPGLRTTPEASIADFMRQTQQAVRSEGALLGASVFGIAVDRPTQIAQDVRQMAKYADYIAPMVYPSHWGPGEFGVGNPNSEPYEIVRRSLAKFADIVRGTDVQIIPWLQDFSLGVEYGPAEVTAQIDAAAANGMNSFLLWAPNCRYHGEALPPGA